MAKEVAIEKRARISKAQQYMILAVLGTGVIVGAAIALIVHFFNTIGFNGKVITEEDKSIVAYSNAIKTTGICKKPKGNVYSDAELKKCNPDSVEISEIPGTLRANILEGLASSYALNSVPKNDDKNCVNPATNKGYTYSELNALYDKANTADELDAVSKLIKVCSALRVIPDALPAFKNEEALLASLNKIFLVSGQEPESLSPGGNAAKASFGTNLNTLSVSLSLVPTTDGSSLTVLNNIERSIRDFNIERATIEWTADGLSIQAGATAYYMDETTLKVTTTTIKPEGASKK